eukprot:PhF_6_TR25303/c0_g1_i1/m.34927
MWAFALKVFFARGINYMYVLKSSHHTRNRYNGCANISQFVVYEFLNAFGIIILRADNVLDCSDATGECLRFVCAAILQYLQLWSCNVLANNSKNIYSSFWKGEFS